MFFENVPLHFQSVVTRTPPDVNKEKEKKKKKTLNKDGTSGSGCADTVITKFEPEQSSFIDWYNRSPSQQFHNGIEDFLPQNPLV